MSKKNKQDMLKTGMVIGTKDEVLWTKVRDSCKRQIEEHENAMKVDNEILKVAEEKILLEKRK